MPGKIEDSSFPEFIGSFLPDLELTLNTRPTVSSSIMLERLKDKIENLKLYYSEHHLSRTDMPPGRKAVVAINQGRNWAAEVKSCVLFADHVICEDPFLNCLRVYGSFSSNDLYRWGEDSLSQSAVGAFHHVIEAAWELMPLIHAGLVTFFPINDPEYLGVATLRSEVENEIAKYLRNNLEIVGDRSYRYLTVRIPEFDYESLVEIDRNDWWGDGDYSYHELAVRACLKWLGPASITVRSGLHCADTLSGTFWTQDYINWKLCRNAVESLSRDTKIYSFIYEFTRPELEIVSSSDILSVRNEESAFATFRKEMIETSFFIAPDVDNPTFNVEIRQRFEDVYKPNFAMIEAAMRNNSLLRKVPWATASAGFAYAGAAASASPALGALFGTLSAALGFGPLFKDRADKKESIRREPAYVFWKLGQIGQSSLISCSSVNTQPVGSKSQGDVLLPGRLS